MTPLTLVIIASAAFAAGAVFATLARILPTSAPRPVLKSASLLAALEDAYHPSDGPPPEATQELTVEDPSGDGTWWEFDANGEWTHYPRRDTSIFDFEDEPF